MVSLDRISRSFDGRSVIDDLSYTFEDTGLYLVTGDNGSGKSTLLYIMALMDADFSGRISYFGRAFSRRTIGSAAERFRLNNISLVMPENNMISFLTPEENESLGLKEKRNRSGDARVSKGLSGGEEILIALKREATLKRPIVLLDEVTSALDEENFKAAIEAIENLAQGSLVIFATHDQRVGSLLADTFLDGGQLLIQKAIVRRKS